jgi:hypothetical protein
MNDGDVTCRFLQTWFMPDQTGYKPQYGQRIYTDEDRHNVLLLMLNGNGPADKQPKVDQWPTIKTDKVAATLNQACTTHQCLLIFENSAMGPNL